MLDPLFITNNYKPTVDVVCNISAPDIISLAVIIRKLRFSKKLYFEQQYVILIFELSVPHSVPLWIIPLANHHP